MQSVCQDDFQKTFRLIIPRRRMQKALCSYQRFQHTLHRGRKHFYRYCLQAFSTKKILKYRINDCFHINGKQRIIWNILDLKIVIGK